MTESDRERYIPDDATQLTDTVFGGLYSADEGDEFGIEDLLDDPRTRDERDQDALDEAAETGEEVIIHKDTARCDDPSKQCNLDHITRVATPDGEIETRRTHTY